MSDVDVGVLIERARERAGLSQRALADQTGLSQSSLSRVKSGSRPVKMSELVLIAEATGYTVAELSGRSAAAERVQCAARSTNGADMEQMRSMLCHFVEVDAYLEEQAVGAFR